MKQYTLHSFGFELRDNLNRLISILLDFKIGKEIEV